MPITAGFKAAAMVRTRIDSIRFKEVLYCKRFSLQLTEKVMQSTMLHGSEIRCLNDEEVISRRTECLEKCEVKLIDRKSTSEVMTMLV